MHLPYSQLVVTADFDPQLPARVLGRFTTVNQLPERFELTRIGDDGLRLAIRFTGADAAQVRRLALKLQTIPSVREVEVTAYGLRNGARRAPAQDAWL